MLRRLVQTPLRSPIVQALRQSSSVAVPPPGEGKLWKITLKRSPIGLHPRTRENARVLGLTRCGHTSYRPVTNKIAGMVVKIKEIIKLELVDQVEPLRSRAADGFEVVGRHNPQIAPGSKAAKPLLPLRHHNKRKCY
ncbi:hypothetical protein GGF46_003590 [Coemansia sp. RSA 552]|nr:hypothetical protein GGF46_003590 [Coemansia sp. RSA 552]